ncbi:hypothetical protein D3C75_1047340 [compost metagenome]
MPLIDDCCKIFSRLGTVKKPGDSSEKVTTMISKPISVPASRRLNLNSAEDGTLG